MSDAPLTNKERRMARKAEKAKQKRADEARDEDAAPKRKKCTLPAEDDVAAAADVPASNDEHGRDADAGEEEEEEPLSHKERRKRRKMEKLAVLHGDDAPARPPARPQRSPFSVWIGNLAFSTSTDDLRAWLREHHIEGVSRVHMTPGARRGEHNKGYVSATDTSFAYVDLPSQDVVEACVALSEESLGGRRLLIKSGTDFRGRPGLDATAAELGGSAGGRTGLTKTAQRILRAQKNPPAPTLFMGNLSFETKEQDIRTLLENSARSRVAEAEEGAPPPSAGIRKIRMGTFEDSGKCKGFAFIDFDSAGHATKALVEPRNGRLLGRTLQLEFAGVDAVRRGASKDLLPDYVPMRRRRRPAREPDSAAPVADDAPSGKADVPSEETDASSAAARAPTKRRSTGPPRRLRPGAANAAAPRQAYNIVPSEGKRTTFE